MLAVAQIAEPGFELWGVVLGDDGAVVDDGGYAGDRGPFAGAVEEGDVHVWVVGEVVGLAGLVVGVED